MKYSDYRRLGKISIKSRKKSTRNTVRGISFGLILIIPILYFVLSFYIDMSAKLNRLQTISSFIVTTKHETDPSLTDVLSGDPYRDENFKTGLLSFDNLEKMTSIDGVSSHIVSEYYKLFYMQTYWGSSQPLNSSLIIDNTKTISLKRDMYDNYEPNRVHLNEMLKVCHPDLSDNQYFTEAEEKDIKLISNDSSFFVAGGTFTGDGKGQIILSEVFLETYKIDVEEIIGKTITLRMVKSGGGMFIDDNDNPDDDFESGQNSSINDYNDIIKNYQVVGILKEELFKLSSRNNEAHLWITKSSVYDENNNSYLPVGKIQTEKEGSYYHRYVSYTYANPDISKYILEATDRGYVFIPIGFGADFPSSSWNNINDRALMTTIIQCHNFYDAKKVEKVIVALYMQILPRYQINITNEIYYVFSIISNTGLYIVLVLLSFGGIIFFATLLNLYNSINYSVQSRVNYIGVMRAIGAKQRIIPRLYFFEIMLIFSRSIIIVLIFSGLLSFLIKYGVDQGFKSITDTLPFVISLNLWYYPVTLLIIVLFEFIIAILYSQIACRDVAKKPILVILKDEK